mmetsp:Transcript_53433/g.106266  ORF Transcript_53433/g.106266 Transcript_53433/m.106266 type:complete len:137 (-) Transcript_53433:203-613(-)
MSGGNYMFVIVAEGDAPIYEAEFVNAQKREDNSHLNQFIIHAALDMVDDSVWGTQSMVFKSVDKFNDFLISAFVTAGHIKLMLLHDVKNEEGIRNFFHDVHELYVKVLMNPFYQPNSAITSPLFDSRVKTLGRRYF